tara:strand:- start:676 stop:942 length:267 start_codon:yes stop_codon:yes gene_type:complete
MGGAVSAIAKVFGGVGGLVGTVLGSVASAVTSKPKRKMTPPEPKELQKITPTTTAQRQLSSSYGSSTMLTGAQGVEEDAGVGRTLLGD